MELKMKKQYHNSLFIIKFKNQEVSLKCKETIETLPPLYTFSGSVEKFIKVNSYKVFSNFVHFENKIELIVQTPRKRFSFDYQNIAEIKDNKHIVFTEFKNKNNTITFTYNDGKLYLYEAKIKPNTSEICMYDPL